MQLALHAIAAAVALHAVASTIIGTKKMGKNTDAAARLSTSIDALTVAVGSLVSSSESLTAQLRETANNAASADDVSIQLNALADKVDAERAAVLAAMTPDTTEATPPADDTSGSTETPQPDAAPAE